MKIETVKIPETMEDAFQIYMDEYLAPIKDMLEIIKTSVTKAHRDAFFAGAASFGNLAVGEATDSIITEVNVWVDAQPKT